MPIDEAFMSILITSIILVLIGILIGNIIAYIIAKNNFLFL